MLDVLLEIARAIVMTAVFVLMVVSGRRYRFNDQRGWWFIVVGFGLLLLASFLDITDNFPALNRFVVLGDTQIEAILEKVVGYLLGFIFLCVGFWLWLPLVTGTKEIALKESEDRFKQFATLSADWLWETGPDHRFTYFSPGYEKKTGLEESYLLGKLRMEFAADTEDKEKWAAHMNGLEAHRPFRDFVYAVSVGAGEIAYRSISGGPIFDGKGNFQGYRGAATDATDVIVAKMEIQNGRDELELRVEERTAQLVSSERRAKEAHTHLIEAIESISEGFILYDANENFVICNTKYRNFYPAIDKLLIPGANLEDIARFAFENGAVREAVGHVDEWLQKRMKQHRAGTGTHEQQLASGTWLLCSERTTPEGFTVGIRTDITSLKNREAELQLQNERLNQLQMQLAEMAKNSAMAQLSSALGHELNQPLTAIINYLAVCRRMLNKEPAAYSGDFEEFVLKAADQADRANKIIRGLRNIVERGETTQTIGDLNETAREAGSLVLLQANEHAVTIDMDLDNDLPLVRINRVQIQQVILNLARNAIEAMTDTEIRRLTLKSSFGSAFVKLAISDTGTGVSEQEVAQLFQPFVSTKLNGLGLGLSISRSIIEAHDGKLEFRPGAEYGATFSISLPIAGSLGLQNGG